ncbi:ATP-binding cassette domain-containing protein [Pantoea sp. Cy-639]|jgi:putative ABC transport system ATP-binding protein|uniref:ATP-binding cassette domain-containing protein n=1 Tax=Pantoea sp. Cy-639 TaxID=2608360 RepID=UPI0014236816|nr:ATP-binding cassette domain-containing protein [Pantoea sp. Cy-639]NIF17292.1 ATP-binding cassette domain-containing protein [Pantoea sp. Cy-639]
MIRLDGVRKTRGQGAQRYSLQVDGLVLAAGERLALVGPSGCGKSTLLDLLALVLAPDVAEAFELGGEDIARLWRARQLDRLASLRSRQLGYVLQAGGLLGYLDVRGNIRLPRQLLGLSDDGSVERLAQALDVHEQLGKRPASLSIGQRQRVSCARALAHAPALLLADEPTAALDPVNAGRVMQLLLGEAGRRRVTCVIATHDQTLAEAAGLAVLRMTCRRDADGGVTATVERSV